jgi:hypothetical protein
VSKRLSQTKEQLKLVLDAQNPDPPFQPSPTGLVEALADLLLESLGVERLTMKGGENEHQDHA